jgi:hypothetical protein
MASLKISLTLVDSPHSPTLPAGVHSMVELMQLVLAAHGLAAPDDARVEWPAIVSDDVFDVVLDALESALAS